MKKRATDTAKLASAIAAFDAGVVEANRREQGAFDGLLGNLSPKAAPLLEDLLAQLRDVLLHRHPEATVRSLLVEHAPRPGYRNVTAIADDVALALQLLETIRNAMQCKEDEFAKVVLGPEALAVRLRSKRGTASATLQRKQRASETHAVWQEDRKRLLLSGKTEREVPGIIAAKHGVTARAVRDALKKRKSA